ncbi:MAG: leucyl/phenylalanyl-tRNA--protein transferase [Ignavibacteriae bacterium]|nr:MAG: leucyl/phenylalanyl-tRNA--protein transferase [Ignavibacteriota bacterium]
MDKEKFDKKELLKPINMLNLYAQGAFPMADDNNEIDWYQPKDRTVIFIDNYNIPRSLRKFMQTCDFEYRLDTDTIEIIKNCADRKETWISEELIEAYKNLLEIQYLHSVGVYQNNQLVGGLYGVAIGGVFFGESMFSKVSQASKSALTFLLKHLKRKGFIFLDVQFQTSHLKMFGTKEIDFFEYNDLLDLAYKNEINFL